MEFVELTRFQFSAEANLLKTKLESEGIYVFLKDEYQIDTDPLSSLALGSVKVLVKTSQFESAKNILNSISKFSLDDKGELLKCPNCKEEKITMVTSIKDKKSFFGIITAMFLAGLPIYAKHKYKCENCNFEF